MAKAVNKRIQIASLGYERWKVSLQLGGKGASEDIASDYLHEVKAELALFTGIPEEHLKYVRLLDRQQTSQGLLVEIEIVKVDVRKGAPVFRIEPLEGPDGASFSEMLLKVDLFPYDEFEKPLTRELFEQRMIMKGIQLDLLDWTTLDKAFETLETTGRELINLKVGQGVFPDVGENAVIEYALPVTEKNRALPSQVGIRRVRKGDLLVRRIPPTGGTRTGRNLFGRELAARHGRDVTLEAHAGTRLSPDACRVIADIEGLSRFEKFEQTIRRRGKIERFPARIRVSVEPLGEIEGNQVLDLDYDGHLEIQGSLLPGSHLKATGATIIHGDVEKDCRIFSGDSIHIDGKIHGSIIESYRHLAGNDGAKNSHMTAEKIVYIQGKVEDSTVKGENVHISEVKGSKIQALRKAIIEKVSDSPDSESEIVVNLREFLMNQQGDTAETLQEMTETLKRLVELFSPKVIQAVDSTNIRKTLHQFLREQKGKGIPHYSPQEIISFRRMLELVPAFREILTDLGQELREITEQIANEPDKEILFVREPVGSQTDSESPL
jgi:hypothetical protein